MPNSKTIWTTKNPAVEVDTIWLTHSSIKPVYVYASQGSTASLLIDGKAHLPVHLVVEYPSIDGESSPSAGFSMERAVVGDEVLRLIKSIPPHKRISEPVKCTLARWSSTDASEPMFTFTLDVANDGVTMSVDTVTVKCEKTNIMTRSVARTYEIDEWTGLELS